MSEILIPAPLAHQLPVVDSPARFKVVRAGRRGGKTVLAEYCAIVGHGPNDARGDPMFRGIVSGLDVVWVARDHTQSRIMWNEFIRPRFKSKAGVTVHEVERTVSLAGGGTLYVVSAENIASVRGMGRNLAGVIVEEAAWLALRAALRDVLLPALMDNTGWLLLISTTNAASDGGTNEAGQPESPSYFNAICTEIRAGTRSSEWAEFHFTALENAKIGASSFQSLVAEYAPDSPSLKQEVYAELLSAGVGLALPSLRADTHLVERYHVPGHWTRFGGFDWGYNHPWVFGDYACDEDGNVVCVDTITGTKDLPAQIGQTIRQAFPHATGKRYVVHAGHDIFTKKGQAVGFQGPTIAEALQDAGLKVVKADVQRVLGLNNLRAYTAVPEDGSAPRFQLMDTPNNRLVLATLQAMQLDPDNLEDALKVDADHAGRGGDDAYDACRYALMSRPIVAVEPKANRADVPVGVSPGYDYDKQRVRVRVSAEDEMTRLLKQATPSPTAGRYRVPVRRAS